MLGGVLDLHAEGLAGVVLGGVLDLHAEGLAWVVLGGVLDLHAEGLAWVVCKSPCLFLYLVLNVRMCLLTHKAVCRRLHAPCSKFKTCLYKHHRRA